MKLRESPAENGRVGISGIPVCEVMSARMSVSPMY